MQEHPDYKYRPRRRKHPKRTCKRMASTSVISVNSNVDVDCTSNSSVLDTPDSSPVNSPQPNDISSALTSDRNTILTPEMSPLNYNERPFNFPPLYHGMSASMMGTEAEMNEHNQCSEYRIRSSSTDSLNSMSEHLVTLTSMSTNPHYVRSLSYPHDHTQPSSMSYSPYDTYAYSSAAKQYIQSCSENNPYTMYHGKSSCEYSDLNCQQGTFEQMSRSNDLTDVDPSEFDQYLGGKLLNANSDIFRKHLSQSSSIGSYLSSCSDYVHQEYFPNEVKIGNEDTTGLISRLEIDTNDNYIHAEKKTEELRKDTTPNYTWL